MAEALHDGALLTSTHLLNDGSLLRLHSVRYELPQIYYVLDGRGVRPSQLQDYLHEPREVELNFLLLVTVFVVFEDEVGKIDETYHINPDVLETSDGIDVLQDLQELIPRDRPAAVCVQHRDHLLQLRVDVCHKHLFPLCCCHGAHDLTQHADEHVHDGERRQQHEGKKTYVHIERRLAEIPGYPSDVVQQRPVEPQVEHGVKHGGEHALGGSVNGQLDEGNRKHIDDGDKEAQGEKDRTCGSSHPLDHDHQLRHGA
mmetsp:Transcript_65572/g.147901  ORF Transcript_65572/g.147901 Transcript_65572/m.147901 type:complete len:257 (+) Transcript_65572:991-1761(+)